MVEIFIIDLHNNMYYEDNEEGVRYVNSKVSIRGELKTDFHGQGEPKKDLACDGFSVVDLNSINRKNDDTCYPNVYLEEC